MARVLNNKEKRNEVSNATDAFAKYFDLNVMLNTS